MTSNVPVLNTPQHIAARLNEPLPRVLELLESSSDIRPKAMASHLRVYDERAVDLVRAELGRSDTSRASEA